MNIHYKIIFFSDWHCGSGLAAGADLDALVVKDQTGLPFVPGKTIKGLVREAVENILKFEGKDISILNHSFGYFDNKDKKEKGCLFFSNAELQNNQKEAIIANDAADYLYRSISSTAIGDNGIAEEHSLRKIEVTVPCTLFGVILGITNTKEDMELIEKGLKYIKRIGQNRNRGLGRCQIVITEITEGGQK